MLLFVHAIVAPVGTVLKEAMFTCSPSHTSISDCAITTGVGFIVILNVIDFPSQPFNVGIASIILTILEPVVLAGAVKAPIFPVPAAASPIAVLSFVQAMVEPVGAVTKLNAPIVAPAHTLTSTISVSTGTGFTVTVN